MPKAAWGKRKRGRAGSLPLGAWQARARLLGEVLLDGGDEQVVLFLGADRQPEPPVAAVHRILTAQDPMYGSDGWFRLTIGTKDENDMFIAAVKEYFT